MVWAAATGTHLEPESSFPFPLRIQQHSWSFVKGSGEWGKSSSPFMDSFLFPELLTFCNFYQLQDDEGFVLQAVHVAFRGMLRSCFPSCPGIWRGVPWHFKQEHFHTGLHGNLDFFFKKSDFETAYMVSFTQEGVLHSGRCPSLRHRKHKCSWQRSVMASHEGWFLKPEQLSCIHWLGNRVTHRKINKQISFSKRRV